LDDDILEIDVFHYQILPQPTANFIIQVYLQTADNEYQQPFGTVHC